MKPVDPDRPLPAANDAWNEVAVRYGRDAVPAPSTRHTARLAVVTQGMQTLIERGLEAQQHRNGRELAIFERDFDRIATFIDALLEGNYRDAAARVAGIAESGVRAWLKAAEDGDERYRTIADLILAAEAIAEAEAVGHVRTAGKDPRFWAAAMTWLERRFPEKYGRRSADAFNGSGVQVIVMMPGQTQLEPPVIDVTATLPEAR